MKIITISISFYGLFIGNYRVNHSKILDEKDCSSISKIMDDERVTVTV
jgi:hypothetical protein